MKQSNRFSIHVVPPGYILTILFVLVLFGCSAASEPTTTTSVGVKEVWEPMINPRTGERTTKRVKTSGYVTVKRLRTTTTTKTTTIILETITDPATEEKKKESVERIERLEIVTKNDPVPRTTEKKRKTTTLFANGKIVDQYQEWSDTSVVETSFREPPPQPKPPSAPEIPWPDSAPFTDR